MPSPLDCTATCSSKHLPPKGQLCKYARDGAGCVYTVFVKRPLEELPTFFDICK